MSTTTMATPSVGDYNPLVPEIRRDPYPYYRALRNESPVHQIMPGLPFFALSRYDDVLFAVQHPELFSSSALQILVQGGGLTMAPNSGAIAGHRLMQHPMMIATDPPDHDRLRRIVNRGFTPRRIATLEPRLQAIAGELLDAAVARGRIELVRDFSIPFPVTVISELLGIEPERREQFKRWSDAIAIGLADMTGAFTKDDIRRNADEMAEYIDRVAFERRARPRDDLVSILMQAEEGDALTTGEVMSFVVLLLIAGNETTTNLIGNATKALLASPDQLEEVMADPQLIPAMIEEALRFESPVQSLPRKAMKEVVLDGGTVPADAFVLILFGSANRDERQFPDPDRFHIHRKAKNHVAFGQGIHFCLGAALARLEARVAFEELFRRVRSLRLEAEEIPMVESFLLRGPKLLPLTLEPA